MSPRQKIKMFLPVFNAIILLIYIINFDISSKFLFCIVAVCLCFCFLCVLGIKSSAIIIQYLYNIQISLFTLILLFLFFELLSFLSPNLIPLQLRNYLATEDIVAARKRMVEYLTESPFVKFKPNTIVRSQGYRGAKNQFVYEWETDKQGFKNLEKIADLEQVDIVAVGDSFTEGIGVSTDKTWSSVLTKHNFMTYNLGVQGYAPKQLEGSLRKYGLRLHPKYIIIGYYSGMYHRERVFFDENQAIKKRKFAGGIQSIVNNEKRNIQEQAEIREQAQYVFSAIYLLARHVWKNQIFGKFYDDIPWRFVVATRNGATGMIFIDGELVKTGTLFDTDLDIDKNFEIGSGTSGCFFKGGMDNVMVFDKALSQEEIELLYNKGKGLETILRTGTSALFDHLVGHWKMNGGTTDKTVKDSSGKDNTGLISATNTNKVSIEGKINGGFSFNGKSDFVNCGKDDSLNFGTGNFSICAWVKIGGTHRYYNVIVGKWQGLQRGYTLFVNNSGGIVFRTDDSTQNPKLKEIATIEVRNSDLFIAKSLTTKWPSMLPLYKREVLTVGTKTSKMKEIESGSKEWKSTISAFTKIVEMATSINAKVILLYLPGRDITYFRKVTGKDLPNRYLQKVESNLLKLFADNNNIAFLDLSERMANYVDDLPDNASTDKYPFLAYDGHPSNTGHALIAEEILNYLKLIDFKPLGVAW